MPAATAIILFAHGARDPQWASPFEQLASKVRLLRPECTVRLAFLELMAPTLDDCVTSLLAEGIQQIQIVPAFMARGAHLKRDLPLLVDALQLTHPGVSFSVSAALGEVDAIQTAMASWIANG